MEENRINERQNQPIRRELVAFTPARSEKYAAGLIRGLREQAERAGYAVTIFENEFDQDEQNEQVREYLAQGEKPGMWIWWPVNADKGLPTLRTLAATGIPVLQLNQLPDSKAKKLVTVFVGPDDRLRARNAAQMMIEARDALAAQGKTFASEGGNAIAVTYPTSYGSYNLSIEAFKEGLTGSGIQLIGEANAGFGPENGYQKTKPLIEQVRNQGIDFIYGMDDALLQGAIQALEEAGYKVGQDVIAVGTVGNGDQQLLKSGKQYGTTLQAPLLEGQLAVQVADEMLRNDSVETFLNFTPNPAVRHNEFSSFTLEGFDGVTYTMDELASWEVGAQAESDEQVLLRMRNISRSFGVIQALKGVNFEIRTGEIMALVGENGAGKSTLVKIISGFDEHFSGNVEMNGEPIILGSPLKAEALGIAIAQQELSLIPTMTVAENVFLADPNEQNWASIGNMAKRAKPHLELVGLGDLDPTTRTDRLSVGEQQLVEIARLIARDAQILILDEPTAALGEAESRRVLERVQALAQAGKSIIYVSHRLDEIFAIADRVTVLRDGRSQEAVSIDSLTVDSLIERMLGRPLENMFPARPSRNGDQGEVVLEVEELWADGLVDPVNLQVRAGEILGLAGQLGSGSSYLLAAMAGARSSRGGKLKMGGKQFLPKSPGEAIKNRIAYCSSDRKKDGLFLELPIYQNMSAPALGRVTFFGWLQRKKEKLLATALARDFQVDVSRINDDSRVLSGGNQQKVAVGKWMSIEPRVILVDEPTRGVDVGARAEIYQRLRDLADSGVAVVFASTDIQEVTFLPDRIVTFYRGQMIDSLEAEGVDSNRLLKDITHPYGESEEVIK